MFVVELQSHFRTAVAFCFYNLSSIVNGLVYYDQVALLPTSHLLLVISGIAILLGGVWVVSFQAGPGVDVGTWDDPGDAEEVASQGGAIAADGTEPLIVDETDFRLPSPVLTQANETSPRESWASWLHRTGPTPMERHTVSDSPTRPRLETMGPSSTTVLSPLSPGARARRRQSGSGRGDRALSPPAAAGFSIGLSPVSPGFTIVPRERRRRVSGEIGVDPSTGGLFGETGRPDVLRRSVGDDIAALSDIEGAMPAEIHDLEGVEHPKKTGRGRWRWIRRPFSGKKRA